MLHRPVIWLLRKCSWSKVSERFSISNVSTPNESQSSHCNLRCPHNSDVWGGWQLGHSWRWDVSRHVLHMSLQVSHPHGLISKSSTYITSITRTPIEVGDSYPRCQFSCDTSSISSSWTNFHKYHKYTSWVGWQLGHSWQLDVTPDKLCLILPVCPDGQVYDAQMHMHPICYHIYPVYSICNTQFPPYYLSYVYDSQMHMQYAPPVYMVQISGASI